MARSIIWSYEPATCGGEGLWKIRTGSCDLVDTKLKRRTLNKTSQFMQKKVLQLVFTPNRPKDTSGDGAGLACKPQINQLIYLSTVSIYISIRTPLLHFQCKKEHGHRLFLPAAIRLHIINNSSVHNIIYKYLFSLSYSVRIYSFFFSFTYFLLFLALYMLL